MLRSLTALAFLPLLASMTAPVQAQSEPFLTRAQMEAHMATSVLCYYPDDRSACGWAELYTEMNADHTILQTASAVWEAPMTVDQYRIDWRGDALCVPYEDQGLQAMRDAEGYRFPFDLEGLTELPEDGVPARAAELRETSPREFCFQYSNDPETPGQLLQHVFRDGVADEEQDPVRLIPRFASGVAIRPS